MEDSERWCSDPSTTARMLQLDSKEKFHEIKDERQDM